MTIVEKRDKLIEEFSNSLKVGQVILENSLKIEVVYTYTDENTIQCWDTKGNSFFTHYKSLA